MKLILTLLIIAVCALACEQSSQKRLNPEIELPYYNEATFTPLWIDSDDQKYDWIHTVADFQFIDQKGDTISNQTFENQIYVTNFFFTICPSVCPKMTKNLDIVQEEFSDDDRVKILSHTVMPWVDSVARLAEYATLNEIQNEKWHLVTGAKEDLYKMARESYFADEGFGKTVTSSEDFLHTENIILVDQKRRIRGIYNGTIKLDMKRMIDDIYSLL